MVYEVVECFCCMNLPKRLVLLQLDIDPLLKSIHSQDKARTMHRDSIMRKKQRHSAKQHFTFLSSTKKSCGMDSSSGYLLARSIYWTFIDAVMGFQRKWMWSMAISWSASLI